MTEPSEEKVDPFPESPLGVDPEPEVEPEPTPPPPSSLEESDAGGDDSQISLSPEEYQQLVESQSALQTIMGDPQAANMIREHFDNQTANQPSTQPPPPAAEDGITQRLQQMEQRLQSVTQQNENLQEQLATITVASFAKDHPDFERHRVKIGQYMNDYPGMTLEKALTLAKAEAGQNPAPNGQPQPAPVRAAAETKGTGDVPGVADDSLAVAERDIMDRSKTPSMDRALDLALRAAQHQHGVR